LDGNTFGIHKRQFQADRVHDERQRQRQKYLSDSVPVFHAFSELAVLLVSGAGQQWRGKGETMATGFLDDFHRFKP